MNRRLHILIAAAVFALPGLLLGQTQEDAASARGQLVGTYRFISFESKNPDGSWQPDLDFKGNGYITYSDTGYMGVHIMPSDRAQFAANRPTPDEARQALRRYVAYFGPFTVHQNEQFVIHHRVGNLNPGGTGDTKRFYDLEGDRLILTPAPASGDKAQATLHVVWERVPEVQLSAEAEKFVGVRQLLYTDRYTEREGNLISHGQRNDSDAGSYIIYTPTGHMMVHLMDKQGRTRYAGAAPTGAEAQAALRSYYGYFGPFTLYEDAQPPYVVHNQEGIINPSTPTDTERLYQLSDDVLRLGVRPRVSNGVASGGHLYWQLLPPRP